MSLTKIGSIGINTGIQFAGVTTVSTLHVGSGVTLSSDGDVFATGISTFSEDIKVGSGVTISPDGDAFFTGIITGNGSGLTNLTGIDLVNDTTPQLGGNLDVNTKNIVFGDSGSSSDDRLVFGSGSDLSIYHDGSRSVIAESGTGPLRLSTDEFQLMNVAQDETMIYAAQNLAVSLNYNGSTKFATTNTGVDITGNATISGAINTSDNQNINVGNGGDLKIFHDGTDSFIHGTTSTRQLKIRGQEIRCVNEANSEIMARFIEDGAVELYHDNAKKFETFANGVKMNSVTSQILWPYDGTSNSRSWGLIGENGSYGKFELLHSDGADTTLDKISIRAVANGDVELYHNNSKVFETTSVGVNITGQSTFVRHSADANFIVGSTNAQGAYLVLDGDSNGDAAGGDYAYLLHNSSGNLVIDTRNPGGDSQMQFNVNGSERLRIQSGGGISFNGDSATANALDDYEEGTFDALICGSSNPNTYYTTGNGYYTKIGNTVDVHMTWTNINMHNSSSGNVMIRNLPFTSKNIEYMCTTDHYMYNIGFNTGRIQSWYVDSSASTMQGIESKPDLDWDGWSVGNFTASSVYLRVHLSYLTT